MRGSSTGRENSASRSGHASPRQPIPLSACAPAKYCKCGAHRLAGWGVRNEARLGEATNLGRQRASRSGRDPVVSRRAIRARAAPVDKAPATHFVLVSMRLDIRSPCGARNCALLLPPDCTTLARPGISGAADDEREHGSIELVFDERETAPCGAICPGGVAGGAGANSRRLRGPRLPGHVEGEVPGRLQQ